MKKIGRNKTILSITISLIFLISIASGSVLGAPTATTEPATDITQTSATLIATFDVDDEDEVEVYFEINGDTTPTITYTTSGTHTAEVTGLTSNTEYEYRVVLKYTTGWWIFKTTHTIYGDYLTFTTLSSGPDTIPPEITITNPGDGTTVHGNVNINFDATDVNGINSQRILIDGVEVSTDFSYNWDTTNLVDGSTHTIRCEATDSSDNMGFSTISVIVDNTVPEHNPILFVHGWAGDAGAWDEMKAAFINDGWDPNILFAYTFADTGASVGQNVENAQEIAGWVEQILAQTGADKVDLISHSMGGLSTRYYIKYGEGINTVDDYVCLDSPQHGSTLARFIGGDFTPDSQLITDLNTGDETPGGVLPDDGPVHIPGDITYTAIYATDQTGVLDGADVIQFPDLGHNEFRTDPEVYEVVKAKVED